jgi:hypothetical protein
MGLIGLFSFIHIKFLKGKGQQLISNKLLLFKTIQKQNYTKAKLLLQS